MKETLCLAAVITLFSCATAPVLADQSILVGRWALAQESMADVPPACANIAIELTSDNRLITRSGQLTYETFVEIIPKDGGFEVTQRFLKHNGEPNCQGRSAEYVAQHLAPTLFLEPIRKQLRY